MTGQLFTIALIFALFFVAILLELQEIKKTGGDVRMKIDEVAAELTAAVTQFAKAKGEIVGKIDSLNAKIAELEAAIQAMGDVPQAVVDRLAEAKALAQEMDDIVADA